METCPEQALFLNSEEVLSVDRQKCKVCGKCVSECYPEALTIYGKEMTAKEVFDEVHRDNVLNRKFLLTAVQSPESMKKLGDYFNLDTRIIWRKN